MEAAGVSDVRQVLNVGDTPLDLQAGTHAGVRGVVGVLTGTHDQESLRRERRYIRSGHIWCFKLTNRTVVDAGVGGNIARFINHSCRPNCYIDIKDGVIWIRAARTIPKGQELTYNYNTDGEGLIKCHCRPDCQTLI